MSEERIRCMVVDDELPARELLESYISKIPGIEWALSCESAIDALQAMEDREIHLVFLDIQMPELTGVEFLSLIRQKIPAVIFTTAYSEYALIGYELGVVDYLLKPFSLERFIKAVDKAKEIIQLKNSHSPSTLANSTAESKETSFFVKSGQKVIKVAPTDLMYVEGMKEYVALHMQSGQRIMTYQRMKSMEELLPATDFVRIHRSFIVNRHFLTEIEGHQLKVGDKWLPVGGNYKEVIDRFLDRLV